MGSSASGPPEPPKTMKIRVLAPGRFNYESHFAIPPESLHAQGPTALPIPCGWVRVPLAQTTPGSIDRPAFLCALTNRQAGASGSGRANQPPNHAPNAPNQPPNYAPDAQPTAKLRVRCWQRGALRSSRRAASTQPAPRIQWQSNLQPPANPRTEQPGGQGSRSTGDVPQHGKSENQPLHKALNYGARGLMILQSWLLPEKQNARSATGLLYHQARYSPRSYIDVVRGGIGRRAESWRERTSEIQKINDSGAILAHSPRAGRAKRVLFI